MPTQPGNPTAILDDSSGYLKTQRTRPWVYGLAALLLMVGLVSWLFFGSVNVTTTGYCRVATSYYVDCVVPAGVIDALEIDQTVWVGEHRGPISRIDEDYSTYDELLFLFGHTAELMHLDKNSTYYVVRALVGDEPVGVSKYTIVLKTLTPFQLLLGGAR